MKTWLREANTKNSESTWLQLSLLQQPRGTFQIALATPTTDGDVGYGDTLEANCSVILRVLCLLSRQKPMLFARCFAFVFSSVLLTFATFLQMLATTFRRQKKHRLGRPCRYLQVIVGLPWLGSIFMDSSEQISYNTQAIFTLLSPFLSCICRTTVVVGGVVMAGS